MTDAQREAKHEAKELRNKVLYMSTSIAIGGYDSKHLINKLDEMIGLVRNHSFQYRIKYSHDVLSNQKAHDQHIATFTSYAMNRKAKVISTLQDVQRELSAVKPNDRSALYMIRRILTSDFFQSELQNRMLKETITTRKAKFTTGELIIN